MLTTPQGQLETYSKFIQDEKLTTSDLYVDQNSVEIIRISQSLSAHLLFFLITDPYLQKTQGTGVKTAAIHPSNVSVHFTLSVLYIGSVTITIPPLARYLTQVIAASALDATVPYVSSR